MNRSSSLPVGLPVVVALLLATGCTTSPPPPARTGTAAAPAASPGTAAPDPVVKAEPSEDQRARKLLDKAVAAMGGAAVVDGVKTLVLTGTMQQRSPLGDFTATVTTTLLYPASVRRDVTLPTGDTVSSVFTPEGAYMTGSLGTVELDPAEKERIRASAMRIPLSLLKARQDPLFRASTGGPLLPGTPGDLLIIRIASAETQLFLDAEGRTVQVSYVGTNPFDASKTERIRVVYSDFRTVTGLTYPFASDAWTGDEKVLTVRLDSIRVNEAVPAELFRSPGRSPGPTSTPTSTIR